VFGGTDEARVTMRAFVGLLTTIVATSVCGSAGSGAVESQQIVLFSTRSDTGEELEYRVSQRVLDSTSPWLPLEREPPLAIHEAAKIVASYAKPSAPEKIDIVGFDLASTVSETDSKRRWYYSVWYYDLDEMYGDEPPEISRLVVLMDGTLVEGVRKNQH
jgi:hypothetical protein